MENQKEQSSQQAKDLQQAINTFIQTKTPNTYVQEIPTTGDLSYVYGVVFVTQDEAVFLRQNLSELAKKGIIVSIAGDLYRDMAMGDRQAARRMIKEFTRHNDKLGFDFDVTMRKHRANLGPQFDTSAYPKFLQSASAYYDQSHPELSAHFKKAANQFTITPQARSKLMVQQERTTELPIDVSQYERKIAGLEATVEEMAAREGRLREETYIALDHQEVLERKIRGYEGKALVDPQKMVHFPTSLRKNMKTMFNQLTDGQETKYIKALVDPFHPECAGARVPTLLPRDTATFNTYNQVDIGQSAALSSHLLIGSLEQSTKIQFCKLTVPDTVFVRSPISLDAPLHDGGAEQYNFMGIELGGQNSISLELITDDTPSTIFTKHRVVSTGMRFFKTSASDSESGQLDLHYSRDGATIDSHSDLRSLFNRPTNASARMYLAGSYGAIRGQTGFIAQCSYRPHDQKSFEFHDPSHDQRSALFGDNLSPVWFYTDNKLIDASGLYQIIANGNATGAPVWLVTESLQQRHTFLARLSNMSSNMQISVEYAQHLEGIPESTHYGFIQKSHALLTQATSPLELIQKMPTQKIFSNYAMKREDMLQLIYSDSVRGLWGDTLFPMLKHMVSYGADALSGDTVNNMIEAALDATMVTLSAAAPELAPAIVGLKEVLDQPLQDAAQDALSAAKRWAVGQQYPQLAPSANSLGKAQKQENARTLISTFENFESDSLH